MKTWISFFALLCLIGLIVFVAPTMSLTHGSRKQSPVTEDPTDPTTLKNRIKIAKSEGRNKVQFPGPTARAAKVEGLNNEIDKHDIVIGQPVSRVSLMLDPWSITTFYKIKEESSFESPKLMEKRAEAKLSKNVCCLPAEENMLLPPLGDKEFYLRVNGGTIQLDGIDVTIDEELGELRLNQSYLFFVTKSINKTLGIVRIGKQGVYVINGNEIVATFSDNTYPLHQDITAKHNQSLSHFKNWLRTRTAPK